MDNLPVNITDIAVIVVVLVSAFLAYARGFVHEVLSVAGWVGAGFITAHALPFVEPFALELIPIEKVAPFAAGAVVFIVSLVILSILTRAISRRVQDSAHNALDRSLGFLFGMVRGAVLVCLIYILIEWMMPVADQPAMLRNAQTMPLIETGADILRSFAPDISTKVDNAAEQTNKLIESQKIIEGLISPEPKSDGAETIEGYGKKIRTGMERLIDSSSQQ